MKIAFVCTRWLPVPPIAGGAIQIYIDAILPILSKYHEITVFNAKHGELPDDEVVGNVRYVRIFGKTDDEYIQNVKKQLSRDYDLIHIFNTPQWIIPLSEAVPKSVISLSLHNQKFSRAQISPEMAEKCIGRVSFITTVSKFIADDVKNKYPTAESKLKVVYSGVDINEYKPFWSEEALKNRTILRREYGIDDYKIILYVGKLCSHKGAHILVKAMKNVMNKKSKTALVFVGSSSYGSNDEDAYIKKLKKKAEKLQGPVKFTGFLRPDQMPQYFNMGDIFVCASQWKEPLARVHYEAMAAGLPIITTDRGGNAEVIKNGVNGMVLQDYNNASSLTKKILYLVKHEDIALNMGKTGRELAEQKYDWNRVAYELLEILNKIEDDALPQF